MHNRLIYLDHAATTPLDPRVLEAMLPFLSGMSGNASSIHQVGRAALQALDDAREQVALVLGCQPKEIVFTSGGSESINLALKGVAMALRAQGKNHLISSTIEHHAVLHALDYLVEYEGFRVTLLPVDRNGRVNPADLSTALRPETALVSVMYANNETGVVQPIADLAAICRERGVLFHTDAVQAPGQLPLDVNALGVDLLSLTAHKFYGPQGVGLLYLRRGTPLVPQINGGAQERRRRAGTENIAGIVGLAKALTIAESERTTHASRLRALSERLIDGVLTRIPQSWLNGDRESRLPSIVNLGFACIETESLLLLLDQRGICASSGSACTSGSLEPSHVLLAMGLSPEEANGSIRFSLGKQTTDEQIDIVLDLLPDLVAQLRTVTPCA
ncbi:cysteine desulfurase family protein [Chloroflexus sp. MS-CIW-1]|jgi:cysteine desulfurase|uniref:cysteine desulfurase family protein n=1 Tax=Chloroflexus sp. MS-CIW-1 TaxID=3055768 RepID=UPI001AFF9843|nr:cysteine desulfurase family protein [Chloroflexus sp. MS-CIW-1]MBO9349129.1 cysteine desulfurase [Chloroflexus sp.]MDN5271270.1 cysteine desulfurase family protein [Chloroflexus sp. MS-CIW-1]